MLVARLSSCVVLIAAAVLAAQDQPSSPANRPWPPPVQDVSSVSPALSPTDALKAFVLPPGYRVELVASEPLVRDPVAIDWDPEGRLWVVEMPGYMRDIAGRGEHDPIGRIVVLRDDNDDGRMDTRKVFADGLVMPRAVKVLERGVLVGEPPHVWLMRDTDGDLRADTRTLVTREYGRLAIDPQNNANGLHWGLDNRIHLAGQADILLRLGKNGFDVQRTLRRGQWGVTHDDAGRIYRNTNESALHVDLVPTVYFERHPSLLRTRGSYERLADQNPDLNVIWPARRTPGTNRAYQSGILRDDGSLARFTAVCAPLVYRGDRLPADLQGNVFVAEPAANLVSRLVLEDAGGVVRARKAYERGEFLASTDERFRPVYLSDAPDGTLYVVDMYRGVLEHRLSLTEYLRDHIVARQLVEPTAMGRIYRVVHETSKRDTSRALSTASPAQLTATLAHPNGWRRDTAQRLLVERADRGVVPPLVALASRAPDWRTRLQALWTLDGMHAIEPAVVSRALDDDSWAVRAAAVRLAERWLGEPQLPLHAAVMTRVDDGDWAVRRQLAASLGALPMPRARSRGGGGARRARARSGHDGRRDQQPARRRAVGPRVDDRARPRADAAARRVDRGAGRDHRPRWTGDGGAEPVRCSRGGPPRGVAAFVAGVGPRNRAARRADAGISAATHDSGSACRAVPDLSGRPRRSGRRVCVTRDRPGQGRAAQAALPCCGSTASPRP